MRSCRTVLTMTAALVLAGTGAGCLGRDHAQRQDLEQEQNGFVVIRTDSLISPLAIPVMKLHLRTPAAGEYKIKFCLGPAADPWRGGLERPPRGRGRRTAVIAAKRLSNGVLFVSFEGGQAAVDPIPFEVTIE